MTSTARRAYRWFTRRGIASLALGAVLALMVGDNAFMQTAGGIDPLEVLSLKVKPNVIIMLDTSLSMREELGGVNNIGGDAPRSKLYGGKRVLREIVKEFDGDATTVATDLATGLPLPESDPVSFMLATFSSGDTLLNNAATNTVGTGAAVERFTYQASSAALPAVSPTMDANDRFLSDTLSGGGAGKGVQGWMDIRAAGWIRNDGTAAPTGWNKLYYTENATPCVATIPAAFYAKADGDPAIPNLAHAIENAMNTDTCSGNTYSVSFCGNPASTTVTISALTRATTTATATTSTVHDFVVGQQVVIAGGGAVAPFGGTFTIASVGANTFTYAVPNSGATTTTGTRTAVPAALSAGTGGCSGGAAANNGQFIIARATGTTPFRIQWNTNVARPDNIAGALNRAGDADTALDANPKPSDVSFELLFRPGLGVDDVDDGPTPISNTIYMMQAAHFFNGDVFNVDPSGVLCGRPAAPVPQNPPNIKLQLVNNCTAQTPNGDPVPFFFAGGQWASSPTGTGANQACGGAEVRSPLVACNTALSQSANLLPLLNTEIPLSADGKSLINYSEREDGTWSLTATPTSANGGIVVNSSTPAGKAINDIKVLFTALWNTGQTASAGPPPRDARAPISTQSAATGGIPKEKTILLYVTDGDNFSCDAGTLTTNINDLTTPGGKNAALARHTARQAQRLYEPITGSGATVNTTTGVITETTPGGAASSVTTYVIGFGSGVQGDWMNWIAWGGSGMGRPSSGSAPNDYWGSGLNPAAVTGMPTTLDRNACTTCVDAFQANDVDELASILRALINTGASSGAFTAQQSITSSVWELAGEQAGFNNNKPSTRYDALVPNQFQASFTLPGFQGELRALQFDPVIAAPNIYTKWSAGAKLLDRVNLGVSGVANGMNSLTGSYLRVGAVNGQGTFTQLHGGATDSTIATAAVGSTGPFLRRRIYTTSRNGTFSRAGATISALGQAAMITTGTGGLANLLAGSSPGRVTLWPPTAAIAPADDTTEGILDPALGLPTDVQIGAATGTALDTLYTNLSAAPIKACLGTPKPTNCGTASPFTQLQVKRARREARQIILAFTAGAQVAVNATTAVPLRITTAAGSDAVGDLVYKARPWVLAESTLAPPAIVGPPIKTRPVNKTAEYVSYIDGDKVAGVTQNGVTQGFGLRMPDLDSQVNPATGLEFTPRPTQKPVMTVAYLAANDMLHAFRAGPQCNAASGAGSTALYNCNGGAATTENGGEELWGFVPYDRLIVLKDLIAPQTRLSKKFVIAASIRFADVFVDAPGGTANITVGTAALTPTGVWRQMLFFGRGKGGKYVTALDVTNRGPYTGNAMASQAPMVLWNRGNPDTHNGLASGDANVDAAESLKYARMGETWSTPAIAAVDRAQNFTGRRPYPGASGDAGGVPFVAYMGSGYGTTSTEGTTFYTLDAVTGDVVAAGTVTSRTVPGTVPYNNALVASPIAYSAAQVASSTTPAHPADPVTRVYIGDLHGRIWKFLSASPGVPLLFADVGANQPIATAGALIALNNKPYVFMTSGNDSRATAPFTSGPFKFFGFSDNGSDTNTTVGAGTATADPAILVYPPAEYAFSRALEANFRGTIAPATAFSSGGDGRVFFGGTRLNVPGTPLAPTPPPCRSSFDSIVYAVGATSGGAAYDLNSSGDDSFVIFNNSRKTAIQVIKQPAPPGQPSGKGQVVIDEGLMCTGATCPVQPPPPPGLQPKLPGQPSVGLVGPSLADPRAFPQYSTPRLCQ